MYTPLRNRLMIFAVAALIISIVIWRLIGDGSHARFEGAIRNYSMTCAAIGLLAGVVALLFQPGLSFARRAGMTLVWLGVACASYWGFALS